MLGRMRLSSTFVPGSKSAYEIKNNDSAALYWEPSGDRPRSVGSPASFAFPMFVPGAQSVKFRWLIRRLTIKESRKIDQTEPGDQLQIELQQ